MEWAIEVCKEFDKPVAASMCIGPEGDLHGVSAGECAVRMAKAGAHVGKREAALSAELIGSLKLGNVWAFVQLIFLFSLAYESAEPKPKHCQT